MGSWVIFRGLTVDKFKNNMGIMGIIINIMYSDA